MGIILYLYRGSLFTYDKPLGIPKINDFSMKQFVIGKSMYANYIYFLLTDKWNKYRTMLAQTNIRFLLILIIN